MNKKQGFTFTQRDKKLNRKESELHKHAQKPPTRRDRILHDNCHAAK